MGPVRSALRHLAGAPGFTAIAILSLTLAIGPTTAIFSLIDELLLRTLPVPRPEELVLLRVQHGVRGAMSNAGEGQGGVDPVTGRQTGTPFARATFERLQTVPAPMTSLFAFAPLFARDRDRRGRAGDGGLRAVRLGRLLRRSRSAAGDRPADRADR